MKAWKVKFQLDNQEVREFNWMAETAPQAVTAAYNFVSAYERMHIVAAEAVRQ